MAAVSDPTTESLTLSDVAAIEWMVGTERRSMAVDVLIALISIAEDRWYGKSIGWDLMLDLEQIAISANSLSRMLVDIVGDGGGLDTAGVDVVSDVLEEIAARIKASRGLHAEGYRDFRVVVRGRQAPAVA